MTALISNCGKYRYKLTRGSTRRPLVFCMLNPSTADETLDDPTIRRCWGFGERFGHTGILVVNLYAYRATDPRRLFEPYDPVGTMNNWVLSELKTDQVICAWGTRAKQDRVDEVVKIFRSKGIAMKCLGVTKDGHPKHPLYLPYDSKLIDWPATI